MNIFPLTIFKDQIKVKDNKKKELINHIIRSSKQNIFFKSDNKSWTGDINHEQFLLSNKRFKVFLDEISNKARVYIETLGINISKVNMYLNRSWGYGE